VLQIQRQVNQEFSPPHRQTDRLTGSSRGLVAAEQVAKEFSQPRV